MTVEKLVDVIKHQKIAMNAVDVIKEYGLGVDTGLRVQSGFCSYPVFKFDLNKVNEYALEEGES